MIDAVCVWTETQGLRGCSRDTRGPQPREMRKNRRKLWVDRIGRERERGETYAFFRQKSYRAESQWEWKKREGWWEWKKGEEGRVGEGG